MIKKIIYIFLSLIFLTIINSKVYAKTYKIGDFVEDILIINNKFKINLPKGKWILAEKSAYDYYISNKVLTLLRIENNKVKEAISITEWKTAGVHEDIVNKALLEILFKNKYDGCYEKPEYTVLELYKKGSTPYEWFSKLKKICEKNKIILFASVFDLKTVDYLEKNKCPMYKVASPEITDIPLIEKIAKTNKPVLISTGLAEKKDIELAVKTLKKNKCKRILIMKCTSSYPAPINEVNLKTMQDYQKKFKVKIGFSDHTLGNVASMAATA